MESMSNEASETDSVRQSGSDRKRIPSRSVVVGTIAVLTLVSQLISLAFGRVDQDQSFSAIVLPSILILALVTIPLSIAGIRLGQNFGVGAPRLESLLSRRAGLGSAARIDFARAVSAGLVLGIALVGLRMVTEPYLPEEIPAYGFRGVSGSLAVSFGAAVAEEVWFRLGLLTISVWLVARLLGRQNATPGMVWTIIVATSVIFGLAHLPQLISYGADSALAVIGTIFGNTVVGIFYGWIYWNRSLFAAVCAHFAVDLMIHVLPALVG